MYHCVTGATGFQNFFPTLTSTLYPNDNITALLLVAPPYVFMVFYSYGHSLMSDRLRMRYWFWMYPIPIVIVGCLVFMYTDSFGSKYFSLFLLNFAFAMNSTVGPPKSTRDVCILTLIRYMRGSQAQFPDRLQNEQRRWLS